jgi:hypothetical protein
MTDRYDRLLFITTEKIQTSDADIRLERALGLPDNSVQRIVVSEDNLNDTMNALESSSLSDSHRYIVNVTCGTKIMSIGVYKHFSHFDSEFYYLPSEKNMIENLETAECIPLNYRINIQEYLTLYGLKFTYDTADKKQLDNAGDKFETYIFNRLRTELKLRNGFIFKGVKLFRDDVTKESDNEIDVIWINENQVCIGGCKLSLSKPSPVECLDRSMYKLVAVSKEFGLGVNMYIFTRHRFNPDAFNEHRMTAIQKRLRIFGIRGLLSENDLKNPMLKI